MTSLRIATYNIRKALGTDRRRDPARVLRVIRDLRADIVLLQEADFRLQPRLPVFQRDAIADITGLSAVEFSHGRSSLGWHGNAVLIAPELRLLQSSHADLPGLEPRGYVEAVVAKGDLSLRLVGVHLGLLRASRRSQLTALNSKIRPEMPDMPTLIAGDFNERSLDVGLGRLARHFQIYDGGATYHSRFPMFALDRIAVTSEFSPIKISAHRTCEASLASDHLPLVGEFTVQSRSA